MGLAVNLRDLSETRFIGFDVELLYALLPETEHIDPHAYWTLRSIEGQARLFDGMDFSRFLAPLWERGAWFDFPTTKIPVRLLADFQRRCEHCPTLVFEATPLRVHYYDYSGRVGCLGPDGLRFEQILHGPENPAQLLERYPDCTELHYASVFYHQKTPFQLLMGPQERMYGVNRIASRYVSAHAGKMVECRGRALLLQGEPYFVTLPPLPGI